MYQDKRPQINQHDIEEQRGLTLPDLNIYYKATVIKAL